MVGEMKYRRECALCPTKVWDVVNGKFRQNSEYHELEVKLNNLSEMKVAVCPMHTEPTKEQLVAMSGKVKKGWMEEVAFGIGNEQWVRDTGLKLEITGVAK